MLKPKASVPGRGDEFDLNESVREDEGLKAYEYSNEVIEEVTNLGIAREEPPRIVEEHETIFPDLRRGQYFDGRLPTVIKTLSLDQLSALYSLFSNWHAYIIFQTKKAAARRSEAKAKKEFHWSFIRRQKKFDEEGVKRAASEMSDAARMDPRFVEINAEFEKLDCLYEFFEGTLKTTSQDMAVISREVTIRQTELEMKGIGRRMGHRGQPRVFLGGGEEVAEHVSEDTHHRTAKAGKAAAEATHRHIIKRRTVRDG